MKTKRTTWLPAGCEVVCAHKLDGLGWRFEAHLNGELVARAGQFRTNGKAGRAAKCALRAYAYERLEFFAGQRRYHAGFGRRTLCGLTMDYVCAAYSHIRLSDVDCARCAAILHAIEAERAEN